jgi:Domain of unknown function (DUF1338)
MKIDGYGISSLAEFFMDFGYTPREELRFPEKNLKALWFSPPSNSYSNNDGTDIDGPLPRVFISELIVDQMSSESQVLHLFFGVRKRSQGLIEGL